MPFEIKIYNVAESKVSFDFRNAIYVGFKKKATNFI